MHLLSTDKTKGETLEQTDWKAVAEQAAKTFCNNK